MLYHLLFPLYRYFSAFNVFRYISFRAVYGAVTALLICLILGPLLIRKFQELKVGQRVSKYNPKTHFRKEGTPTMGGLLILTALITSTLLWARWDNRPIWLVIFSTLGFGLLGFIDDYIKLIKKRSLGLKARYKLAGQAIISGVVALLLYYYPLSPGQATLLKIPLFKYPTDLNWLYIPFAMLVIMGTSNAVNLTDGLDGLAIGPFIVAAAAYSVMSYLTGHAEFARYLRIFYIPGSGELTVFCAATVGASLGFLWFNTYPAELFMGDIGSLALGGALGTVAVLIKKELLLLIIGGIFVVEALSVIIQLSSAKLRGRLVFRMAPLHHHFELLGWAEPKITVRFWIIAIILALMSLSTLKLR